MTNTLPFHFGIEIEFYAPKAKFGIITSFLAHRLKNRIRIDGVDPEDNLKWTLTRDDSCGLEIVSPILTTSEDDLYELGHIFSLLQELEAAKVISITRTCGIHVHVGIGHLPIDDVRSIIFGWDGLQHFYSSIIANFRRDNQYCLPNQFDLEALDNVRKMNDFCYLVPSRYRALNTRAIAAHKTLEFRSMESTLNPIKVFIWILLLRGLYNFGTSLDLGEINFDGLTKQEALDIIWEYSDPENFYFPPQSIFLHKWFSHKALKALSGSKARSKREQLNHIHGKIKLNKKVAASFVK